MKNIPLFKLLSFLVCCILFGCTPEEEKHGTIYGTVTDFSSGDPIANANVKLNPRGETTLTGYDGAFQFDNLLNGNYSLSISKNGYVNLDDDYIIKIENGNSVSRDVQMQKELSSLKIADNDGNPVSVLDFGIEEGVNQKTFSIFNDGNITLDFAITKTSSWIVEIVPSTGTVNVGDTKPVYVIINRELLEYGENYSNLLITTPNAGGVELKIKAVKSAGAPTVTTGNVTNITHNSASCGGNVVSDGGSAVTSRGICWSTSPNPTIDDSSATSGDGTGSYSCNMTNLQGNTTYYVRAYARNSCGINYGSEKTFETLIPLPTFQYEGHTYYVAPSPNVHMTWETANTFCNGYCIYGITGWRLPTKGELMQMYADRYAIGGFDDRVLYWSNTPSSYNSHFAFDFGWAEIVDWYDNDVGDIVPVFARPVKQIN